MSAGIPSKIDAAVGTQRIPELLSIPNAMDTGFSPAFIVRVRR
jgi:hypothetical protein